MRRHLIAFGLLAAVGAASAVLYSGYATERDFARLVAAGDEALAGDVPFQALEAYSGAVALRPDSMVAHLKRGRLYYERGDFDAAARDLRRAVELDPTATRPLEWLGDTDLARDRPARAAERYEAYLALDDRSPQVWYKLGLAWYRSGRARAAIDALQRALVLDGGAAEPHLLLGLCLMEEGRTREARVSLERAVRLAPGLTGPREALARLFSQTGDAARAVDHLEALAALDPTNAERFVALGLAHARTRRHEAAVLTLSRAVERFPNDPRVYGALGRVWLESMDGRPDAVTVRKAIEALSAAASHPDVSSATLDDLARAWLMQGDLATAERYALQATARTPRDPRAYATLAEVSARTARWAQARDALIAHVTISTDPRPLADLATQIATYAIRAHDPAGALTWIDRAVDADGRTPHLAELRRRAVALAPGGANR